MSNWQCCEHGVPFCSPCLKCLDELETVTSDQSRIGPAILRKAVSGGRDIGDPKWARKASVKPQVRFTSFSFYLDPLEVIASEAFQCNLKLAKRITDQDWG